MSKSKKIFLSIIILTLFLNVHCEGENQSLHHEKSHIEDHDQHRSKINENSHDLIAGVVARANGHCQQTKTFITINSGQNIFLDLELSSKTPSNKEKPLKINQYWPLMNNKYTQYMRGKLDLIGFKYQKMLVYIRNNTLEPLNELKCLDIKINVVEEPDMKTITDVKSRELFRKELKNGNIMLGSLHDDVLTGYVWLSFTDVYVPEIDEHIHFKGTYIWNLYTFEHFRRRGIAKCLIKKALELGYEEYENKNAYAITSIYNVPSRKVFEANGFKPIHQITVLKLFGKNIYKNIVNI